MTESNQPRRRKARHYVYKSYIGFRPTVATAIYRIADLEERDISDLVNEACIMWLEADEKRKTIFDAAREQLASKITKEDTRLADRT